MRSVVDDYGVIETEKSSFARDGENLRHRRRRLPAAAPLSGRHHLQRQLDLYLGVERHHGDELGQHGYASILFG